MHSDWRCLLDGSIVPLHVAEHIDTAIVGSVASRIQSTGPRRLPMWCPWPLPVGWTMTGVGWAGDDHRGVLASVVACSGPCPVEHGPADLLLVAEEPGVGLGARYAGIPGPDPGPHLLEEVRDTPAHARVHADGWPTPLWSSESAPDRSVYVGEARGLWLYIISWPSAAGYVLAEELHLHDLGESVPSQLAYGAPSPYLHGKA